MDILGIGMSVLDSIQMVDEFPSGSGVTQVCESTLMGGGPVPTALCAAARLGATAAIVDRIGDDWQGDRIAADYARFGVVTDFLQRERGHESSAGIVLVRARDGERHLIFREGTFTEITAAELPDEALRRCRYLHLNGRHWPACLDAARLVRSSGGLVSFDGGANRYDKRFEPLLDEVDILIVAHDFACEMTGEREPQRQLAKMSKRGAGIVGVTWGERGSWFQPQGEAMFHIAAFPVESVVDTTGCGDVFHGAFLAALVRGRDCKEAAQFASAAAALSATALGGRGYLPSWDEVEGFLAEMA